MMERVAGEMDTEEAADLLERAVEPMRDLVAAMRAKLLVVGAAGTPRRPAALSEIAIRAAEPDDHDALFRIYAAVVEEGGAFPREPPADELMFREGWFEGKTAVYVAEVGRCRCRLVSPAAELRRHRRAYRQRGIHGGAGLPSPRRRPRARRALSARGTGLGDSTP